MSENIQDLEFARIYINTVKKIEDAYPQTAGIAQHIVDAMEEMDAVFVTRCKNCRLCLSNYNKQQFRCGITDINVTPDDYCSFAISIEEE